jgi:hypothetical protein
MPKKPKADQLQFDRGRPEGAYQSDAFFPHFTPVIPLDKLSDEDRRPYFELFRYDVDRAVRVARVRAQREDEIEPARQQAFDLQDTLAEMHPQLQRIANFGDPVDFVARVSTVFQPRAEQTPTTDIKVILTQLLDALQGPHGRDSYVLEWLREFDRYEVVPRLPPRREPLVRHLIEQAIALHVRRLDTRPPASRQHWQGAFLAALWQDVGQSVPNDDEVALADRFGRRIEDAVKRLIQSRS